MAGREMKGERKEEGRVDESVRSDRRSGWDIAFDRSRLGEGIRLIQGDG